MFCESYRESLKDAAAGAALPEAAKLHLAVCANCADALAEEEQLYRALDSALHKVANADVPASLVPQVRAEIASTPVRAGWRMPVIVLASALVVIAAIFLEYPGVHRHPPVRQAAVRPANGGAAAAPAHEPDHQASLRQKSKAPVESAARSTPLRVPRTLLTKGTEQAQPEVLVSSEEQAGLQQYTQRLRARSVPNLMMAVLQTDADRGIHPVEIKELEFARLTIEPLDSDEDR